MVGWSPKHPSTIARCRLSPASVLGVSRNVGYPKSLVSWRSGSWFFVQKAHSPSPQGISRKDWMMAGISGNRYRTQGGSTELSPATCSHAKQNAAAGRLVSSANRAGIVWLTALMQTLPDVRLIKYPRALAASSMASDDSREKTVANPLPENPLNTLP